MLTRENFSRISITVTASPPSAFSIAQRSPTGLRPAAVAWAAHQEC
jgi:hypothetical protein